jgi:phenylacetate-coenzyme A ligase PaaK-like adenylate-forming protein
MRFVEEVDQFLIGSVVFPAVNFILNRRGILGRYRKLLLTEHYSEDALRELQFQKGSAVLRHVYKWIQFYTRRFKEIGLVPEVIKTMEDIRHIPPLVRQDVIDHRLDMVDVRYRHSASATDQAAQEGDSSLSVAILGRHRLIRSTTTGSTGTPTVFYEDGSTTALNWVHEQRLKHWFGLRPGAKEARMKGISTLYATQSMLVSAREYLWNQSSPR